MSMTPKDLKDSINDSWPADARFAANKAVESWEAMIRDKNRDQNSLILIIRTLSLRLKDGWWRRFRKKGYERTAHESELICISAERKMDLDNV